MKLATLKTQERDGALLVVSRDLKNAISVENIAPNLQTALDFWSEMKPQLTQVYDALNVGEAKPSFNLKLEDLAAPLPRAYQFLDGSAYLAHVERVRKARGAEMPPSFLKDPLMYQAASDGFLAWHDDVLVEDEAFGIDFEAEVGVITTDTPQAVSPSDAGDYIALFTIMNDVSLRNLIPQELGKGFGFLQSKPRSALSPVFVTADELGNHWRDGKVHLPLISTYNKQWFGHPNCGVDMQFSFPELIAHAAKTRPLVSGSLIGSGTIANQDISQGSSCLAEKRVIEVVEKGKAITPFMSFGDSIKIEMLDEHKQSIFGAIDQTIKKL